ncbi:MAG TPA: hypothetical protein VFY49_00770 [Myxococcota bacterium]|nr:hypothetical protein [Myxococcota bacterium]
MRLAAVALARYERARARALRAQGAGASERARASVLRSAEGARLHEFALDVETDWRRFARGERILCLRRRRTLLALFRRAGAVASLRIPAREVALLRGTLLETAVASAHRSGLRPSWIRAALACWVGAGLLQVEPALEETR